MEGKEAIIGNIISVAQSAGEALVRQAVSEKNEALNAATEQAERKSNEAIEKAKHEAKLYVERQASVASLEMGKTLLRAKQEMLASVYSQAVTKILNMTDNLYRELIGKLLKKYAENNDEVMVSSRDAKRLNADFIKSEAQKLKINLSLSPDYHNGQGGIILVGKSYDKNLTFTTMLGAVRAETESKVAKKLFNT